MTVVPCYDASENLPQRSPSSSAHRSFPSVQISGNVHSKPSSNKSSPSPNSATNDHQYFFPMDRADDHRRSSLTDDQRRSSLTDDHRRSNLTDDHRRPNVTAAADVLRRKARPSATEMTSPEDCTVVASRRNSDSFSLTKVRKLQQKFHEPKRSLQHHVDFFNSRNSQNNWSKFADLHDNKFSSSINIKSRQDITSLFGSYSSLVNLSNQRKSLSGVPAQTPAFSSKNCGYRGNNLAYEGATKQCISPAYATISSSAYRELTQKVK